MTKLLTNTLRSLAGAIGMIAIFTTPSEASSVSLNVDGSGQLLGATGIEIDGDFFDVEFLDGTCI